MKRDGDDLILSTGRKFPANNGIVGINDELQTFEGYDGSFDYTITLAERLEIAEYMIDLWERWKGEIKDENLVGYLWKFENGGVICQVR